MQMEVSRINLKLLGIKSKTKNELYRIFKTEANLYLPPQKDTSIYLSETSFKTGRR